MRDNPPFLPGDYVVCLSNSWKSIGYGSIHKVHGLHQTNGRWYLELNVGRYGLTSFNAEHFSNYLPGGSKEEKKMYVLVDISDNPKMKAEDFNVGTFGDGRIIAAVTNESAAKDLAKEELTNYPKRTIAIFALTHIVERDEPPIRIRDMR